ncbi:MAG: hypothetical protein AAFU41_05740 [Pseudomonadota bacterium]
MTLPPLPYDIPYIVIFIGVAFLLLLREVQRRFQHARRTAPVEFEKKKKRRGPDMAFSAGRDAAHQNTRFQHIFVPMPPDTEPAMRAFYLDLLGLQEMRAPNYPEDSDGFWAVSGTRRIYFGTQPSFPYDTEALPAFPIAQINAVAETIEGSGRQVTWDTSLSYVKRFVFEDPAGNHVILIAA